MDLKLIKKLLDLISESDADEVTVEEGEFKLKVKKNSDSGVPVQYQMSPYPAQPAAPQVQSGTAPQADNRNTGNPGTTSSSDAQSEGELVKSPIVGTFYRSPSPEESPFVLTGDKVEAGQTLCIIEAMKIMNEIEAEFSGTVEKVLIEDGTPVEFDQPLFIIKKG